MPSARFTALFLVAAACALAAAPACAQPAFYFHLGTGRLLEAEKGAEERMRTEPSRIAGTLPALCYIYLKLRRYGKLFACADQLEARIRAGHTSHIDTMVFESDVTPLPHFLRAAAHLDLGDPKQSLAEGETGIAKLKETSGWGFFTVEQYLVESLPVLGIAAMLEGRREEALRYMKMLADVSVPYVGGQNRRNLKDIGLARLNIALGNYDKALGYLQEEHYAFARAVADALLGGGDSFGTLYLMQKLLMLGKSQQELGLLKEAKESLDQLIGHRLAREQGDVYWIALYERGRNDEKEGKREEAIELFRRAIEIIEEQRSSLATEAAKIGFAGNRQQVYARLISLLIESGDTAAAFDYVERSKARALVDMLAGKKDFALRGPNTDKTRTILAELDRAGEAARAGSSGAVVVAEASGAIRSIKEVRSEIAASAPELASLVAVGAIPAVELRNLLAADETLVEYYYDDNALYAFVVTRENIDVVRLDQAGLGEAVAQFRRRLEQPAGEFYLESARPLHERLITPLAARIKNGPLTLVAHGALHYLPFAALQDGAGRFLIDRYALRSLPSASVLKFLRPPASAPAPGLLAFGNPDLDDPKLDLAFAEGEARAVAALFPGSRVLVRKEASKANFKKAAGVFGRIHIASHGKFRADAPLDSGLLLAAAEGDDGLLRVAELYSTEMNADLVTLSACETGLGKIDNGDDVVGLTRGFLYAGARSIVSTLWSVDDRGTAELMQSFYENLRNAGKIEALRQAQIKTRAAFPHPFFWAAFQLTGRPD